MSSRRRARDCAACLADRRGESPGVALAIGMALAHVPEARLCASHAALVPPPPERAP